MAFFNFSCYILSKTILKPMKTWPRILQMLQVFLAEYPEIEHLLCGARSRSETSLHFCNDLFSLWLVSVSDDLQLDLTRMADKTDSSVVLTRLQVSVLWECNKKGLSTCGRGHSPFFQILFLKHYALLISMYMVDRMFSCPITDDSNMCASLSKEGGWVFRLQ